ncbi:MAG: response regulator transcription factor [Bacteroidales bacterium]
MKFYVDMDNTVKVIIVDDHEIFRNGLKLVINKLKYAHVIAEAGDGVQLIELLKSHTPDIVFMDIQMPRMNGIEATQKALELYPNLKIIALTMFNEDDYIQNMIDSGVRGFLLKNVTKEILDKAIQNVVNDKNYYSEELFQFFTRQLIREEKEKPNDTSIEFTRREKEILQLLMEGLSNKEIADVLHISERTVVGHKSNLLSKTNCKSTIGLLSYAIKNKLIII